MNWSYQKVIFWFSIAFTSAFILASLVFCQCVEVVLYLLLLIFFLFYLTIGILLRLWMNGDKVRPSSFLLFSFFTKTLVIILFAKLLVSYISIDHRLILLVYVVGYIIASVFDVLLMYNTKSKK